MKKFLINSFIFSLILCIPNIFVFKFAQENYYQDYDDAPPKIFTKFLFADSHGQPIEDFSEEYGVYNFSAVSESYVDIRRKLKFLIAEDYQIDTVYLSVDDHILSPYRDEMNNNDKSEVFLASSDYDNIIEYYKKKYLVYYGAIFQPKVREVLKAYLNSKSGTIFSKEDSADAKLENWSELNSEERDSRSFIRISHQFGYDEPSTILKYELLEIIELCQSYDIELIGLKFPLPKELLETLGNKNYGADTIMKEYNLKIIDFKEIFVDNPEYFKDQDHLNTEGGKEFVNVWLADQV